MLTRKIQRHDQPNRSSVIRRPPSSCATIEATPIEVP